MRRSANGAVAAAAAIALGAVSGATAASEALPRPPSGAALAAVSQPPAYGSLASQRIYFVMPDRYANGDPANDRGGLEGIRGVTGYDPADTGYYHGGDLKGLVGGCTTGDGLARIRDLGFTALWVTPPVKQKPVIAGTAGYHGYWGLDFTTVDPHLGTEADFAALVDCAHRLGMKVFLDVVVNHTADVILPTGGSSWAGDVPYRDCKGKVFDPARYAGGRTFPCLNAKSFPRPPLVLAPERDLKRPAWLNDPRRYHNRGDVDWTSCSELCYEQGDFFGLDDLFTEQPVVVDGLAALWGSWIAEYKVDGFRIDTARHVDRAFFRVWVPKIMAAARAAGVRDFQLFGEVFLGSALDLVPYVRDRGLPNLLDFPLQGALTGFAGGDVGARAVASRLDDDDYFRLADGRAPVPPTFLGNHDMGRAAFQVQERSQATGGALLRRDLLAHDLLYLLRGAPTVLYGDEIGMLGRGGDQQARQDLFPTQVDEWRTQPRVGSSPIGTGSGLDVRTHPVAERLRQLAALRDAHPALSTGATVVRRAQGPVLAVSRIDGAARREYVAAFNSGTSPARVSVTTATPGASWGPLLGDAAATSAANGSLTLTVPALGTVLLRAEADLPSRAPARPTLRVRGDDLTEMWEVGATVAGAAPVSVAFAVRRKTGGWRRLAVDDSPRYRALLDPVRFRRGEKVHLVAVARSVDGRTAVSRVVPFTVRRR
ncbi:MAG TPA: alpha-amylase family glycosyl hydrolase [Gaiellaceae bacterium]|nr:alpha-amylase family glycosyl hydrolase [Gaiellaceae bacterium]